MELVKAEIEAYIASFRGPVPPVLAEMEALAREQEFPIVGPQVGQLLAILARGIGARRVLELGSGFGYSALWFAEAMGPQGRVDCTEGDPANRDRALDFLGRAGVGERVQFHVGDALELAQGLAGPYDIVFNDVDKEQYPETVELTLGLLRSGGLFITDNTLWKGRVLAPAEADEATRGVLEFNRKVHGHPELTATILPVRDGLCVAIRR